MATHNIEYTLQGGSPPYTVKLFSGGTQTQIGSTQTHIADNTYQFSDVADGTYDLEATDDADCELKTENIVVETLENQYNLTFFVSPSHPQPSQDPASPHVEGTEVTLTGGSNTSEYTFTRWRFYNSTMTETVSIVLLDGTSVMDRIVKVQMPNFSFVARPMYTTAL